MALSAGNTVPSVLPMPVGACASRQRLPRTDRHTASASVRWPWRKSASGKRSACSAWARACW